MASRYKKLFLFDFDGVIMDSLELYEQAVSYCLKKVGAPPLRDREEFLSLFDNNFYEAMAERNIDLDAFTSASAEIAPDLDYSKVQPNLRLPPVLEKLMAGNGNGLFIISSNSEFAIKIMLAIYDLDRYFENVLGYEFMFSKENKIIHAVEEFGTAREDTYYICDTAGDVKEAKNAGVKSVAVTWGWHPRERLALAGPDFLIDSPEELLGI
jgi:phosphoglycolate phosphatase